LRVSRLIVNRTLKLIWAIKEVLPLFPALRPELAELTDPSYGEDVSF